MSTQEKKVTARVYQKHGPTLRLIGENAADAAADSLRERAPVQGTTLNGEKVTVPHFNVLTVVEPAPETEVRPPADVFYGKRIQIRSLATHNKDITEQDGLSYDGQGVFTEAPNSEEAVVVIAEDLAQAEVVVLNPATGEVYWVNPACPAEAITKTVAAVMLLAEAEELVNLEWAPGGMHAPVLDQGPGGRAAPAEDQVTARVHFERGDLVAAMGVTEPEQVADWLRVASRAADVAVMYSTHSDVPDGYGVITSCDSAEKTFFTIQSFDGPVLVCSLTEIHEVLSFEWDVYQHTGELEHLTEYGRERVNDLPVPSQGAV